MGIEDTPASNENIVTELDLRTNELRSAASTLFDRAFITPGKYGDYHIFHYDGQSVAQQDFPDGTVKRIVVSKIGEEDNPSLSIEQVQFVPDRSYYGTYNRLSTSLMLTNFVPITTTHEGGYFSNEGYFRVVDKYSEETNMLDTKVMDDMRDKLLEVNSAFDAAIAKRSKRRWWQFGFGGS